MSEENKTPPNSDNQVENKEYNFKEERLWLYLGSALTVLIFVGIIEMWVEAGRIFILELIFSEHVFLVLVGAAATFLAFFNFTEIDKDKRIFWDYFFFILLILAGGICVLVGGIVYIIFKIVTWYLKEEFSAPVYSNDDGKNDTYHVGKDVAGYDRIYNQDGKEITTVESIGSNGDVYGTDGNKYTKK